MYYYCLNPKKSSVFQSVGTSDPENGGQSAGGQSGGLLFPAIDQVDNAQWLDIGHGKYGNVYKVKITPAVADNTDEDEYVALKVFHNNTQSKESSG